ncbi:MAG: hypothetical protein LBJ23_09395 [Tannerella sp.]|jgi:hypothetical protein|nr:hypothetical protein [Tannerella sp.]
MIFLNPKIKYYRIRTFGERLNVSFDYLRETWKPLLKFSLYLILPICLIQSFAINAVMRFSFRMGYDGMEEGFTYFMMHYVVYFLCLLLGSAILGALVYTLMQVYDRRETRLADLGWTDFKPLLIKNFKKSFHVLLLITAFMFLYAAVMVAMAILSPWTLIITVLLLLIAVVVFGVPFTMLLPIYLFEDRSLKSSLQKTIKYGFGAWGEIFLVMFVFGLLANIISWVTTMPWYILTIVGSILGLSDGLAGDIEHQFWYMALTYTLGIVQSYGVYVSSIITAVGYAFQYFHLCEKREGVSVQDSILNFDKL